jgi:hypothetical protein
MTRFAFTLLAQLAALLLTAAAIADTPPFKGEAGVTTYSGYFDDGVKVDAAAVAGAAGWYEFTDAAMDAANVAAGVRSCVAYTGVDAASLDPETDDAIAYLDGIRWSGTATVDAMAEILTDTGATLDDLVDDLEARLTALRAAYLDKLNISGDVASQGSVDDVPTNVWASGARSLTDKAGFALAASAGTPDASFFGNQPPVEADVDEEAIAAAVAAEIGDVGGESQPRINFEPDPAFTFRPSDRADGVYICDRPLWLVPGTVEVVHPAFDMSGLFGKKNFVRTVGAPVISGGSITPSAEGPRDWFAITEVSGTATASEERSIVVPITMVSGATVKVKLEVKVFAE